MASTSTINKKVTMRITVLIISNSYPNPYKSYAGKHVERHNILLQEAGLNIIVASPGDSRQGWFFSSLKYLLLLFKVFHHVLFSSFDLIHAHWELPSGLIGLFAATIRHKPFVLTSHGAFTNNYDDRPIWQQQLIRFTMKA